MTRLEHLKEAQRLERLWDNVVGADNHPTRKRLAKEIARHRKAFDKLTKDFIEGA